MQGVFTFNVVMWSPPKYVDYEFPGWTHFVGWLMALSSMMCIPVYAIYKFITSPHPGTWKEVSVVFIVMHSSSCDAKMGKLS